MLTDTMMKKQHGHEFNVGFSNRYGTGAACWKCGHSFVDSDAAFIPDGGAVLRDGVTYVWLTLMGDLDEIPEKYKTAMPPCPV